ncbi:MAG TPA: metallophosphoesterase [Vicinamibacterales bacterium]|nr:metallophosphoesterase [Vicinamibacterales bacterium]
MRGRLFLLGIAILASGALGSPRAQTVALGRADSLKFAVIGDNGTGGRPQFEVGQQMTALRATFPFEFVLMMGDNLYGTQDFVTKFERPYQALLSAGVKFYAAIGNHDDAQLQVRYPAFNMNGARYYSFVKRHVRFVVADTNFLDQVQLAWLENTLRSATEQWTIVFFHHPLYSNGDRHGSNVELRVRLEPLLVAHGVDVVMSGHDHIYERIAPQKGITYFVIGSSGQLRRGGLTPSQITAAGFADDQAFTVMEIAGPDLTFQTLSRTGRIVDSGVIRSRRTS